MKNINWPVTILIAIVIGAAAFFGGMQYQKSQRSQFALNGGNGGFRRFGQGGTGANGNGIRPLFGQIISSDANSITVKMQDGSTKIVLLSGSTSINKAATGTKNDLTNGTAVAVFGTANSDGSVTAQSVQVNPQNMRFGGPRPSGGTQPTGTQ